MKTKPKPPSKQPAAVAEEKRRNRQRQRERVGYTPERIYTALAKADEQTRAQVLALLAIDKAIIL